VQALALPPAAIATAPAGRAVHHEAPDATALGIGLLSHCATEMNHLASFLPALHAEFGPAGHR
jgi:hypothetical protein